MMTPIHTNWLARVLVAATLSFHATPSGAQGALPIGGMIPYAGEFSPASVVTLDNAGWLPCDGRAINRLDPATNQPTRYAPLFNVIQTNFGAGYEEGVGTDPTKPGVPVPAVAKKGDFNLPDCRGRFLRGVDDGSGRDADRGARPQMRFGGNSGDRIGSIEDDQLARHSHAASGSATERTFASVPIGRAEAQTGFTGGAMFNDGGAGGIARPFVGVNVNVSEAGGSETRPKNLNVNWIIRYR